MMLKICSIVEEQKFARKIFIYHTLQHIYRTLQFIFNVKQLKQDIKSRCNHTYKMHENLCVLLKE